MDLHARRKETAHPGAREPMVELHVFAGVEGFVKRADEVEHLTAIRDGHALRRNEALVFGIDVRRRMMSKPRRPRRGDGALERRRLGHVERLRAAETVGAA